MALDTNWRENTGTFVCARSGNDVNAGTKALPKQTLQNNGNLRVRAGFYTGVSNANSIIGDGLVIWDASGDISSFTGVNGNRGSLTNVYIKNHINFNGAVNQFNMSPLVNCKIESCRFTNKNLGLQYCMTKELNDDSSTGSYFRVTFVKSQPANKSATNCFFDSNTISPSRNYSNCAFEANVTSQFEINSVNIKDITLDGETNTIGNIYGSNERFSGTATVGGQSVTFTNCFYTDNPMFNDPTNEDYTLQTGSPLINEGNIIGCYGVAVRFDATHPAFQVSNGASIDSNITVNGDTFELTSGSTGRVISSPNFATSLELPYFTYLTEAVRFFGGFNYNNGDWIDEANYNSSSNPEVRLTYKIRVYDESTSTWGTWYDIENFMAVERDSADLGNGDVNADIQNLGAIGGKNFQVDFVIRNNGV